MKLLHTADWHLGDSFHGFDREEEHTHFLNWLIGIIQQEEPDALLMSGDIYDNANPSASSERALYSFLTRAVAAVPKMKIIMIAGNHDSSLRLEAPRTLYECMNIEVRGTVKYNEKGDVLTDDLLIPIRSKNNSEDNIVIATVPFLRPDDMKRGVSINEGFQLFVNNLLHKCRQVYGINVPIVLMAHFYAVSSYVLKEGHSERSCIGGQDCVNVSHLGKEVAYAALGHIHKEQSVAHQENVRYAGSVLSLSFAEKDYEHGIIKVEIENGTTSTSKIIYNPLRQLISIPKEGSASPNNIIKLLSDLPKVHEKDDASNWPYVEINVEEIIHDPQTIRNILKLVEERAVRLCRIVRIRPDGQRRGDTEVISTIDDLRKMNPAQIARSLYKKQFGEEMPDEISRLFAEIKREEESKISE